VSALRNTYTSYYMAKEKLTLALSDAELSLVLNRLAEKHAAQSPLCIDGVKIDFEDSWVHLRKSNTEPIVRIYTEARSLEEAKALADKFGDELRILA